MKGVKGQVRGQGKVRPPLLPQTNFFGGLESTPVAALASKKGSYSLHFP